MFMCCLCVFQIVGRAEDIMPWESIFSDLCGCRDVRQRVKSGRMVGAKWRESFVDIVEDVTIVDMDTGEPSYVCVVVRWMDG